MTTIQEAAHGPVTIGAAKAVFEDEAAAVFEDEAAEVLIANQDKWLTYPVWASNVPTAALI